MLPTFPPTGNKTMLPSVYESETQEPHAQAARRPKPKPHQTSSNRLDLRSRSVRRSPELPKQGLLKTIAPILTGLFLGFLALEVIMPRETTPTTILPVPANVEGQQVHSVTGMQTFALERYKHETDSAFSQRVKEEYQFRTANGIGTGE